MATQEDFIDSLERKIQEKVKSTLKEQHNNIDVIELTPVRPIPQYLRTIHPCYASGEENLQSKYNIEFTMSNLQENIRFCEIYSFVQNFEFYQNLFYDALKRYEPVYRCTCTLKSGGKKFIM